MKHDKPAVGLWLASWNTISLPYGPFFDTKEEAMRHGVDELDDARLVSQVKSVDSADEFVVATLVTPIDLNNQRLTTSEHDAPGRERNLIWRDVMESVAAVFRRHKCTRPGFTIGESVRFVAAEDTKL